MAKFTASSISGCSSTNIHHSSNELSKISGRELLCNVFEIKPRLIMKTFKKALAALVLTALTLPVWAHVVSNGGFNFSSQTQDSKAVVIQLTNLDQAPTVIAVKSIHGFTYYKERIKDRNGYRAKLDLEQMPEGKYLITVKQGDTEKTQVVRVTEDGVLLSDIVG